MLLVHISDLHVLDLQGEPLRNFANKRLTGLANLATFRRHQHPSDVLDALIDTLLTLRWDHVVVTGDVSNLSLDSEFRAALSRLSKLGGPDRWTIVPGNHDVYTRGAQDNRTFESHFQAWMSNWPAADANLAGSAETPPYDSPPGSEFGRLQGQPVPAFPFAKAIGQLSLFGLCSAIPTPPFLSYGSVGHAQRARLVEIATAPGQTQQTKVALVHHNLHPRSTRTKDWQSGLRDRHSFVEALFDAGIHLVLHGHTHRAHAFRLRQGNASIPVLGCGSSTWAHSKNRARFNVLELEKGELKNVLRFEHNAASGRFEEVEPPPRTEWDGAEVL